MAIVCIAGVARGIGKTAVAEFLLERLEGWHTARVRVADEIPEADAARIGDERFLLVPDADDAESRRLRAAGGACAAVLLAEARGLAAGLARLLESLPTGANLLVEGNAFLWARRADLAVMVIGPGPSGKGLAPVRSSTRELVAKIDLWTWNTRGNPAAEGFFDFPQALARTGIRGGVTNRSDFHHLNPVQGDDAANAEFLAAMHDRLQRLTVRRESDDFLRRIGFAPPDEGVRDG
ncbi:MAG: hypothetical protein WBD63_01875 [Phycisphaerae bacterium]|nr:hypothetical protein [Phycisphaerae bacterium]